MAQALRDTSVGEIEARLSEARARLESSQRTSVATHMAWVPTQWSRAAERVLHGLGARIPSRTLLLHPDPDGGADRLDARIEYESFPGGQGAVCVEVVHLWLRGRTASAPASVVVPLQIPDLPVFLRWRGLPTFGTRQYDQLIGVTDRLIVDSVEWDGLPKPYGTLAESFARVVLSDLAWARTLRWRAGLAELWPGIKKVRTLRVLGPLAEALLLRGWLRSRLRRDVQLSHEPGPRLSAVAVDDELVRPARSTPLSASDLLSAELESFSRDRVYEAAVRKA